jgi:hypothetical protein
MISANPVKPGSLMTVASEFHPHGNIPDLLASFVQVFYAETWRVGLVEYNKRILKN